MSLYKLLAFDLHVESFSSLHQFCPHTHTLTHTHTHTLTHTHTHTLTDSDSEPEDNVRLWEDGWKERYYQNKFGVPSDDHEFVKGLAEQYTRGLCWVLGYYYQVGKLTVLYVQCMLL